MKKILLFCFMGATAYAFAQPGQSFPQKPPVHHPDTSAKKPVIIIRCGSSLKEGDQPLLVLDGEVVNNGILKKVKPADIENITVLKESAATALYGYQAARGVIVITTKKARERTFSIRSKEDETPVAGATIKIVNQNAPADTITMIANDSGEIVTGKLDDKTNYTALISSVGYKPQQVSLRFQGRSDHPILYMERKENVCENVTVVAYPLRRIVCYMGCGGVIIKTRISGTETVTDMQSAGIYPNPSISSGLIHWKLDQSFDGVIQVLSVSGQFIQSAMVSVPKGGVLSHRLPVLRAGTYFIRLVDQKSFRSITEKLVVQ